jgi:hypothetical protein
VAIVVLPLSALGAEMLIRAYLERRCNAAAKHFGVVTDGEGEVGYK